MHARLFAAAIVAAVALAGCSRPTLPDLDVAAAAAGATPPADHAVLVEAGWPEVAAFVRANADAGRATVVNVFASWCDPCKRELPLLLEVSRNTPDVAWLGVASQDRPRYALGLVEEYGVDWPTVFDQTATTHIALESRGMPTTAFFDADGVLRSVVAVELDADALAAELAAITP